jgi:hypothetical protein
MPRNRVQHQKGLSDDAFEQLYPDEEACRKAWFAWRWPEGFKCPRCAGSTYCEIRGRQLLQCRQCRHQTSLIAGTVLQGTKLPMRVWFRAMHLLAPGKKGLSNIELGRRLGISTNAAWRVQHKLMQAMIERDRRYKRGASGPRIEIDDAYIGGERTGEGSGRGRRGHTPFIIAVETTADRRPLYARLQVVRGFQTAETKRLCTRVEAGTTVVSDGGQCFSALRGSRVSSTSATSRAPTAPPPNTPPSAGQIPCSPTSKTASWPHTVPSRPNISLATSAPSLGASTAASS